jgi:phosphocarrier protein FPr
MNFIKKIFQKKRPIVQTTLTITSENGFHLRPIAKFVNEVKHINAMVTIIAHEKEVTATQVPKILSLSLEQGESFILQCEGEDAQKSSDYLSEFFTEIMNSDIVIEEIVQEEANYEASLLKGRTIAKGIALAPLVRYEKKETSMNNKKDNLSLKDAIKRTKEELYDLYQINKTKHESQIFLAQKELISSDIFRYQCSNVTTFTQIIDKEIEKLENTKFASRISDYKDVEQRVLTHLGIKITLEVPTTPYILLCDDLLPSEILRLRESAIEGVILQKGTPTSHASILLRSFAIPSMIINTPITELSLKTILDANSGDLILKPTSSDVRKAKERKAGFKKVQEQSYEKRFEISKTRREREITVLANITNLESAKEAKEQGADGVGLLRTEFLFTEEKPSLKEQTNAYKEIFKLFDTLTIRTLDIGGDKSLPYVDIAKEENPFLGIRGIRFSLQEQTLFKEQLLAIFKANEALLPNSKTVKIMFPMVSTVEEFTQAKNIALTIAQEHNIEIINIQFGIMLEVPSVIFALPAFNRVVDFYSIGTNDLTQYLFAIERTHPTLVADATSPMLMNALKIIVKQVNKPISICGELAGLEDVTQELIGMGYETLSVSAKIIPSLKERIRHV